MRKILTKTKKSKAFTLVELLMVIIIIGVLSGMIMLSHSGSAATAEAARIIYEMRTVKGACLTYYANNFVWPQNTEELQSVDKYLDQELNSGGRIFVLDSGGTLLWLSYTGGKLEAGNDVSKKLAATAETSALFASPVSDMSSAQPYAGGASVYMILRQ